MGGPAPAAAPASQPATVGRGIPGGAHAVGRLSRGERLLVPSPVSCSPIRTRTNARGHVRKPTCAPLILVLPHPHAVEQAHPDACPYAILPPPSVSPADRPTTTPRRAISAPSSAGTRTSAARRGAQPVAGGSAAGCTRTRTRRRPAGRMTMRWMRGGARLIRPSSRPHALCSPFIPPKSPPPSPRLSTRPAPDSLPPTHPAQPPLMPPLSPRPPFLGGSVRSVVRPSLARWMTSSLRMKMKRRRANTHPPQAIAASAHTRSRSSAPKPRPPLRDRGEARAHALAQSSCCARTSSNILSYSVHSTSKTSCYAAPTAAPRNRNSPARPRGKGSSKHARWTPPPKCPSRQPHGRGEHSRTRAATATHPPRPPTPKLASPPPPAPLPKASAPRALLSLLTPFPLPIPLPPTSFPPTRSSLPLPSAIRSLLRTATSLAAWRRTTTTTSRSSRRRSAEPPSTRKPHVAMAKVVWAGSPRGAGEGRQRGHEEVAAGGGAKGGRPIGRAISGRPRGLHPRRLVKAYGHSTV